MEKDRSLKNALNDNSSSEENERRTFELRENEESPIKKKTELPKEDIVDKLLRGFVAFFVAVFISAVVAGLLEVAQGWEISFGSLSMIAITAALYYPSYK
ncbi:MAG: hypothetical protein GVY07_04760, partial [Bacteroidetes bacterium]|nr:hypothetical protein [Bacteroidota bacterium]